MLRSLISLLILAFVFGAPVAAQDGQDGTEPDRSATGGAQTLEDILARQRGEMIDDSFRRGNVGDPDTAAGLAEQLGTLGGSSDPELWRALRYGSADITVSSGGEVATVLVQDGGMWWLEFRQTILTTWGGYFLLGVIVLLVVFFLLRGRIRVDAPKTGQTVVRFRMIERFAHWLLAGSFILLGLTGLLSLFGRTALIPVLGHEANSLILVGSKWIHNNVAWAFMIGLVLVFVFWVWHNLPDRTDMKWIAQFGGIIGSKHPPARKFNAGQKVIFWSVVILGASVSVSGLSLLFPFDIPMFAKTFATLNDLGITGMLGLDPLPVALAPQEEMQYAQLWHAIVSFVLMGIIIAHIYIGSLGMEGAFDAMGTGEVDESWAHQHHSIWLEEVKAADRAERAKGAKNPAE